MNRLLPLETQTLPFWETAPTPGIMETLAVLLGFPFAIFAVILLFGMAPSWFGKGGKEVAVRKD